MPIEGKILKFLLCAFANGVANCVANYIERENLILLPMLCVCQELILNLQFTYELLFELPIECIYNFEPIIVCVKFCHYF